MDLSNNMCRCCMVENIDQSIEMLSIFSKLENKKNIKELLQEAIPRIKITTRDKLPKKICSNCLKSAKEMYKFQKNCIKSEAKFYEILVLKKESSQGVETFDYIDPEVAPMTDDESGCENISQGNEDHKLNIHKIEMGFNLDAEDFVESCSDFSLLMPLSNESDTDEDRTRKKKSSLRKRQKMTVKNKKEFKQGTSPNDKEIIEMIIKCEPSNDDLNEFATNMEETVESGYNLDKSSMCDEDHKFQTKKRKMSNKGPQLVFSCEKCEKTFKLQTALDKHMETHRKLVCNICEEEFLDKQLLRKHKKLHKDEESHLCPDCGKSFATLSILNVHLKRHNNEKIFTCKHCPKSFRTSADLYTHTRIHNINAKAYTCEECDKSFTSGYSLKIHRMRHKNERNFQCEFCDKRFYINQKLQRHRRIHTGEKPYKCKFCDKAYIQTNELTKHLRIHLGENIYQCELCPQRFPSVKIVKDHFISHKNDDADRRDKLLDELNALEVKGLSWK